MTRLGMSRPAAALHRALLERVGEDRKRILLTSWLSTDWKSLTFDGERHVIELAALGPDSGALARRLTDGIEDAEFDLPAHFVAEISVVRPIEMRADGAALIHLEALTIEA